MDTLENVYKDGKFYMISLEIIWGITTLSLEGDIWDTLPNRIWYVGYFVQNFWDLGLIKLPLTVLNI